MNEAIQSLQKVNSFEQRLRGMKIPLDIPTKFKITLSPLIEKGNLVIDELTGLPFETDKVRKMVSNQLGNCLRTGKKFAVIYTDADNLKKANSSPHGRDLGNMVIKYGAAVASDIIEKAQFDSKVEVYFYKPTHAADETIIWAFGVSDGDLNNIKKAIDEIRPIKADDLNYVFSTTSSVVDSQHQDIITMVDQTTTWLKKDESRTPFDLYNEVEKKADSINHQLKINKDLNRLSPEELIKAGNLQEIIRTLTQDLGDSRIGGELLEVICKLVSVETLKALSQSEELKKGFVNFLANIGVDEARLNKAKSSSELLALFQDLFGRLPEDSPL